MGGKALKEVETRRYERDEYLELEREVLDKVSSFLPDDIRCEAIKAYHTKPSFGDMDIVIEHISSKEHIEELFKQWGVKEVSKNSNCWSTHYNDFQVDFIFVEQEYYQSTLDYFAKTMFGGNVKVRFRPSFFPFTEPSAEMDIYWGLNSESDRKITKGTGWLEILGCGMVDPNVFKSVQYDSDKWTGFAFGMGIERIAMLKYGIKDIRKFYEGNIKFLNQFKI